MNWRLSTMALCVLVLVACAPASPSTQGSRDQGQAPAPAAPRTLVAALNEDPKNFWDGINGGGGSGARQLGHMVNQYLAVIGSDGTPYPRLLAEMPAVDKGNWTVFPDGKMEVTWKVRPGVTWHDGTPFTADDIVFSWEICKDPNVPNGNQSAVRLIERVVAVDPQTAVSTWSQTYAFADRLEHREFFPLPKHILEQAYRENKETLIAQPYFNQEYVGTGPFKMVNWEPGAFMELTANDSYFLGRPKIDRVRVMFITDTNTGVANLRAGSLNIFLPTGSPDWDKLESVKKEWQATGKGDVVLERVRWEFVEPQKGPLAQPVDLKDVRVRQALLMAINREEVSRSLQGEFGGVAHSWVLPAFTYYPRVKDAITEYPFDPRRAMALLADVGWTPGPDGILQKGGTRFEMKLLPDEQRSKLGTVIQQEWKTNLGIDGHIEVLSNVLLRDAEARNNALTGVGFNGNPLGGLSAVRRFATDQTPSAANRYAGTNRGAFSSPEWDDVGLRLRTALDDNARIELERELLRVFSAELPALAVQYELQPVAVTGFKGLVPITGTPHTGNIMHTWNVHEWEML
jgi:peptide/nickel transport system substrate-binding protein